MDWVLVIKAGSLIFVLLNPFMMTIYLVDLFRDMEQAPFVRALIRGAVISCSVFFLFAWTGDAIFTNVLNVRFASFLIFGGMIFLVVGIRYVISGSKAIGELRGAPEHIAGSVAMPFMIGPGTVSASVLAGANLPMTGALLGIVSAVVLTVLCVIALKMLHDSMRKRNAVLMERYVDITGRISALVIGTIAVEMILRGIELWLEARLGQ